MSAIVEEQRIIVENQVLEEYKDELHQLKALIQTNMSQYALECMANVLLARMKGRVDELQANGLAGVVGD